MGWGKDENNDFMSQDEFGCNNFSYNNDLSGDSFADIERYDSEFAVDKPDVGVFLSVERADTLKRYKRKNSIFNIIGTIFGLIFIITLVTAVPQKCGFIVGSELIPC